MMPTSPCKKKKNEALEIAMALFDVKKALSKKYEPQKSDLNNIQEIEEAVYDQFIPNHLKQTENEENNVISERKALGMALRDFSITVSQYSIPLSNICFLLSRVFHNEKLSTEELFDYYDTEKENNQKDLSIAISDLQNMH